jgi:hypothetical protein
VDAVRVGIVAEFPDGTRRVLATQDVRLITVQIGPHVTVHDPSAAENPRVDDWFISLGLHAASFEIQEQ